MKKTKTYFFYGMLFLILSQTMVGINIVCSKLLLPSIPIFILLGIRFSLATLILLPLHWLSPARKTTVRTHFASIKRKGWLFLIAQGLTAGLLFNCIMLIGLNKTDANVAGIITSVLPAMIAVMSWLILKEKISVKNCLCILFATAGLAVIAYQKLPGDSSSHTFFGDFIVLLSLLPEAAYYILCKLHPNKLPIFLTSALLNGINALLLLPVLISFHWDTINITSQHWLILIILSIAAGLFFIFWFLGCQRVDGIMTSLSTATMPIATVILAWMVLGESLTMLQTIGMGLVILAIIAYAKK